ncbi:hypothetical protein [Gloeobacter morelensis]|uniref:TonB-dependent receptor n=1 Tax=Gloeobacter morelensis MG652769 TaxID=2781736 RepID=A0ABY3PPR3_9CYAN|nr:hypothetical protein [Gloeobacter morelensis]UFP95625.1 hypothetical protein ISF26_05110 [Gloeobacter morelensis MG652769]
MLKHFALSLPLLALLAAPAFAQGEPTVVTTPPAAVTPDGLGALDEAAPLPPGEFLDEVTVTATRRPARIGDTTVNTYILRKEDFKAVGAVTVRDALILVPGFFGK